MASRCFPIIACSLLAILFIYGIVGIVSNAQELTTTEGHGVWPYNQNPAHGALIVIQICYIATMTFGILAFWREDRTFYYWAAAILLGVFVALFVFGIVCLRSSLKDITADIFNSLKKNKADPKEYEWFSMLQYEYKCCGVSSFNDWSILKTGLDNSSVPQTCCSRDQNVLRNLDCGSGVLASNKTFEDIKAIIYIEPCGPKMSQIIQSKTMYLGMEMLIAAFATIGTATFLYCGATELFCLGNNEQGQGILKQSGSTLSVTAESGRSSEDDDTEYSKSTANTSGATTRGSSMNNSRGKIRFDTANSRNTNSTGNANNSLKGPRGLASGGPGRATPVKKNKGITKSGTNSMQKPKGFPNSKANKNPPINKAIIDKNKISKLPRNPRKWKETSKIASKTLIFGTRVNSKANFTTNVTAQNLEMLFEGIDKNISTLSTTPNPSVSSTFPAMFNRTPGGPGGVTTSTKTPQKGSSTDKTLFPTLSHYSSLPLFHLVKFPTGELGTLGQYSPHFVTNRTQRHTHRHTYFYTPEQSMFGSPASGSSNNSNNNTKVVVNHIEAIQASQGSSILIPPLCDPSVSIINVDIPTPTATNIPNITISSTVIPLTTSLNLNFDDESDNPTALYQSPASTTVRSSTLATIQEESESLKASPAKGATPIEEHGISPQLTNVNMFGGSYINDLSNDIQGIVNPNPIEQSKIVISEHIEENILQNYSGGRRSEEMVPLGPVPTGEFTVTVSVTPNLDKFSMDEAVKPTRSLPFCTTEDGDGVIPLDPSEGNAIMSINSEDLDDGNGKYFNNGSIGIDKELVKADEFEGTLDDEIEDTIAEIGALAKARASKAQIRLGFN